MTSGVSVSDDENKGTLSAFPLLRRSQGCMLSISPNITRGIASYHIIPLHERSLIKGPPLAWHTTPVPIPVRRSPNVRELSLFASSGNCNQKSTHERDTVQAHMLWPGLGFVLLGHKTMHAALLLRICVSSPPGPLLPQPILLHTLYSRNKSRRGGRVWSNSFTNQARARAWVRGSSHMEYGVQYVPC